MTWKKPIVIQYIYITYFLHDREIIYIYSNFEMYLMCGNNHSDQLSGENGFSPHCSFECIFNILIYELI